MLDRVVPLKLLARTSSNRVVLEVIFVYIA